MDMEKRTGGHAGTCFKYTGTVGGSVAAAPDLCVYGTFGYGKCIQPECQKRAGDFLPADGEAVARYCGYRDQ